MICYDVVNCAYSLTSVKCYFSKRVALATAVQYDIEARRFAGKIINKVCVEINCASKLSAARKMFITRKVFEISM